MSVIRHSLSLVVEKPQYELEGDGCSSKVIVNAIARFRLRILPSTSPHHKWIEADAFATTILDPHGHPIVVQRRLLAADLLELTYQAMSVGQHNLSVSWNDQLDRQLTIDVINDESTCSSRFKPFGPGLRRAIVGIPTEFYVNLTEQINKNINHDHLQFCLEPSFHAEIDYERQLATVRYTPRREGDCPVHILEYNRDIAQSPFLARITVERIPNDAPPRLHVTGLSERLIIHRPFEFQVSNTRMRTLTSKHDRINLGHHRKSSR